MRKTHQYITNIQNLINRVLETQIDKIDEVELAELSGMSIESVIRTLKQFQEDKLIEIKGKTFKVLDPDGLMEVCKLG